MALKNSSLPIYEIRVAGELGELWADWFEGFSIRTEYDPNALQPVTILTGTILDQPALLGLLAKIGGFNLKLLSLRQIGNQDRDNPGTN